MPLMRDEVAVVDAERLGGARRDVSAALSQVMQRERIGHFEHPGIVRVAAVVQRRVGHEVDLQATQVGAAISGSNFSAPATASAAMLVTGNT